MLRAEKLNDEERPPILSEDTLVGLLGSESIVDLGSGTGFYTAPGSKGLERVARALKPGGRLVIVDWKHSHTALEHGPPLELRSTWREVVEVLAPHFSTTEGHDLDRYFFVAIGVK
ncbi:MAG: hypothetical protein GX604_04515 [Actinobacteria bacterium]|nr:hypothetical protein [Actinomycetota bacterium]